MLTTVRLDGVMGAQFGKEWNLAVSSPSEALRMIEANKPGLRAWMVQNIATYDAYKVVCVYDDDREEALDDESYGLQRTGLKMIRFTPVVSGGKGGGIFGIVVGAVIVAVGIVTENPFLIKVGATLILGGVIQALSPTPDTKNTNNDGANATSYYFDGPINNEQQGAPVPLIYGRVQVGSHTISASISVDELEATVATIATAETPPSDSGQLGP
jgi:predicted phage tail protein